MVVFKEGDVLILVGYFAALGVIAVTAALFLVRNRRNRFIYLDEYDQDRSVDTNRTESFPEERFPQALQTNHSRTEIEVGAYPVDTDVSEDGPVAESDFVNELSLEDADDEHGNEESPFSMNARQMSKAIRKQQKREQKRARADAIIANDKRRREAEQSRGDKMALREKEWTIREEENKKELELRALKEGALYKQWKNKMVIQEKGNDSNVTKTDINRFNESILLFIKKSKVTLFDELAAEFGLRTQDALEQVRALEKEGLISGLFDGRGKFVHITKAEMESLADYIEHRGRVSVSELVRASDQLICT